MRAAGLLLKLALGVALLAGVQWASDGASGLPPALPAPLVATAPLILLGLFGLFLAAVYGSTPGAALGLCSALLALLVVAVPFAYAHGLAGGQLPDGGAVGRLLAGPQARGAAALWLLLAAVQGLRRRRRSLAPVVLPASAEPAPFWPAGAPVASSDPAGPVAYTPPESGRA